jgi:phage gp29-like protein
MVGRFDQKDDESRLILERAFSLATKLGGIVISKETDVEIKQAMSKDAGEAFELFHGICQAEKSKLIVGQTTSATATSAGGLGSGIGDAQAAVRDDIRQCDRLTLADTLKHQVITPFLQVNRIPGNVTISFGAEAPEDTAKTAKSLADLANAGVEVSDEGLVTLGERMGLPLRRKALTVAPAPESPLSGRSGIDIATLSALLTDPRALLADAANARIPSAGSADLSRALREDLAIFQRMVTLSSSPADLERRLRDTFPDWSPTRTMPLLQSALEAYSVNALP